MRRRVTAIRSNQPGLSGLYDQGIRVDDLTNHQKYIVQEWTYASDASCYVDDFFVSRAEQQFAWDSARKASDIESLIIEELLIEED